MSNPIMENVAGIFALFAWISKALAAAIAAALKGRHR